MTRWLVGAAVCFAALAACCSESGSATSEDAGGADGLVEASGGSGGVVLPDGNVEAGSGGAGGSTGGTGGSISDASTDAWQPAGDPGWKALTWAVSCDAQVATKPVNAVPNLIWTECGANSDGCYQLQPNWPNESGIPLQAAQIHKEDGQVRLGLHMWFVGEWRKALYDGEGFPLAAWRGTVKSCWGNLLQWTSSHVCLAIGSGLDPTYQAYLPPTNPSGDPSFSYATQPVVPLSCNNQLFIGSSTGGIPYLRDLEAGRERWIQFPNAMAVDPSPSGPNAFFVLMGVEQNHEKLTGWVWKRPDTLEQLVDAGSEMVYDIRSDGNTLVWVQTASASSLDPATGTLWTSPFATSASGVESTQRRSVPALTIVPQYKVVGHGHYALVEQPVGSPERYLHVYRLSDARHWKVPTIPDVRPADLIYIDAEEVWFIGTTLNDAKSTIIRQKLDALGPGD
ncbi:MAG TPA: hypothetical protein PL046_25855 [Polyangiaceae bacterium]|nr:MAG: hypothetical protein BWY06_01768 [Candidatus Latescibacteria bacterium ADurb.Bin168]HOH03800.1 hypothetical protein [Polyangiaceae bacterium]